jgi:hypothetical protein
MAFNFIRQLPQHTAPAARFTAPQRGHKPVNPLRPHALGWRPQPTGGRMDLLRETKREEMFHQALRGEGRMKELVDREARWKDRQREQRRNMLDRNPATKQAFQAAWRLRKDAKRPRGAPHTALSSNAVSGRLAR